MKHQRQIPDDFMARMPAPETYYASVFGDAMQRDLAEPVPHSYGLERGWATARCPLGRYPHGHSVRVNLDTGQFACKTCGRGDLLLFHMLRTGHRFKQSVLELIGVPHDDCYREQS